MRGYRQRHVRNQIAHFSKPRKRFGANGKHSAGWKPSGANGENQQTQREQKIRNREKKSCGGSYGNVRRAPFSFSAPNSQRQRDEPRKQCCGECEEQRVPRARPEERRSGSVVRERKSQIAVCNRGEPARVTHHGWPIDSVVRAQGSDRVRRNLRVQAHLVKIISRRERSENKRKDGHAQQKKNGM